MTPFQSNPALMNLGKNVRQGSATAADLGGVHTGGGGIGSISLNGNFPYRNVTITSPRPDFGFTPQFNPGMTNASLRSSAQSALNGTNQIAATNAAQAALTAINSFFTR